MKVMVVYDSQFGNTKQVAQAIAGAISDAPAGSVDVDLRHVDDTQGDQVLGLNLLVVGCPTQKFSPTQATKRFLKSIPKRALKDAKVAAFDTRVTEEEFRSHGAILSKLVAVFGYAAEPIAGRLKKEGGELAMPPEGFYVGGTEGPLLEGELERAAEWGRQIGMKATT